MIKNVSVERFYLSYLANTQPKTTKGYHVKRWDNAPEGAEPPTKDQREALALAASLFDLGCTPEERLNLATEIAKTQQMRQPATRSLVTALRQAG